MSRALPPELPPDLAAHFDAEREIPAVPSDARNRLLAGLAAAGAVGLGVAGAAEASGAIATGTATGTATVATMGAHATGLLARLLATRLPFGLAMFALGGAGGMAVNTALRHDRAVTPAAVTAPARAPREEGTVTPPPTVPAVTAVTAVTAPSVEMSGTTVTVGPAVRPAVRTVAGRPTGGEDRPISDADGLLVDRARSALNTGMLSEAAAALRESERRFPSSDLADARECIWIRVLVAQRRFDEARARGQRFHQRFPGSMQGPTVDDALANIPDGG